MLLYTFRGIAHKNLSCEVATKIAILQWIIIALIFSIILIGCDQNPETPPLTEETQVSGIIETDTIWTKEHSPYIVTDDIIVERNVTLTIQPGAEVLFDYMEVHALLKAVTGSQQQSSDIPEKLYADLNRILSFKLQKFDAESA